MSDMNEEKEVKKPIQVEEISKKDKKNLAKTKKKREQNEVSAENYWVF